MDSGATRRFKKWLVNKGVVKAYSKLRIYRPKDDEPVSKNRTAIKIFGIENAQGISTIQEEAAIRGIRKKNTKTVSELILG